MSGFAGFGTDTMRFLAELEENDDTPHIEDIKRKDFIATYSFSVAEAGKSGFPDLVAKTFHEAKPLMAFLRAAVEVNF